MLIAFEFKQNNSVRVVRNIDSVLYVKVSSMIAKEVDNYVLCRKASTIGNITGEINIQSVWFPLPFQF
jgi:hypothetical protein